MSKVESNVHQWEIDQDIFYQWIENREHVLSPGLKLEPTIKVLIFLALLDAQKACSYKEIREVFDERNIIKGVVPDNTLRTSVLNLSKTLDKFNHSLELKSLRGNFQLLPRLIQDRAMLSPGKKHHPVILLQDPPAITAEEIAYELIEKARLSFQALYFSERAARGWEIFSYNESQIRVQYEINAWDKLEIKNRLHNHSNELTSFVSLAPGEGLAEIELLKKILREEPEHKVHYMAIDSSSRLLREHMNLLGETLASEINEGRLICVGLIADIFSGLRETTVRARAELISKNIIHQENDFLPATSSLLVTYLGNCLGNHYQDQETEIFSIVHSTFPNRPLEFLVGVSVMRQTPDEYKRNWDDFLLQTPRQLLEMNRLLESARPFDSQSLPEFNLSDAGNSARCPSVIPESYIVRHGIQGQIYRFYYILAYNLGLATSLNKDHSPLPRGTMILLYNIVKYNMKTLVSGIKTCGLFDVKYDQNYHQIVDTPNGKREYAVFSAFAVE